VIVLGFDTATPATAVALRLADGSALRARDDPAPDARPGHTARLLVLAHELLQRAGLRWADVERIAVGLGPGTFTGLRVGVASARGLGQSLGVPVIGIQSTRALAAAALADTALADAAGAGSGVLAVIDACRGEAFLAVYEGAASAPRELAPPRALAPAEFSAALAALGDGRRWLAVGDGAIRFQAELQAAGATVAARDSPLHRVDAAVLCELALTAVAGEPEGVLPDYRRRPDAEIALEDAKQ
jgi:tRNA threonylcarbamoyladenosine biosynthesis protein TsaB